MQLREAEIQRLEEHLSECENCRGLEEDFRGLRRLLRRFGEASEPDPVAVVRLHVQMAALTDRDDR